MPANAAQNPSTTTTVGHSILLRSTVGLPATVHVVSKPDSIDDQFTGAFAHTYPAGGAHSPHMGCKRYTCGPKAADHLVFAYAVNVLDRQDLLRTFRERLAKVIRDSGLNQSEFAAAVALDRSTLSQLLSATNRRLPRVETLAAIAAQHQSSLDWLIGLLNVGPMQAEIMDEQTSFAKNALAHNDERLIEWLRDAVGYKIRYVPSTLPDLLKTEEVIQYEMGAFVATTPDQQIETASAR